jgi:hypothetical protein
LLKEGIPTVRFTAKECQERTTDIVTEFLGFLLRDNLAGAVSVGCEESRGRDRSLQGYRINWLNSSL